MIVGQTWELQRRRVCRRETGEWVCNETHSDVEGSDSVLVGTSVVEYLNEKIGYERMMEKVEESQREKRVARKG